MCGIVAYIGRKIAQPLLIEGLKRLEYRGYDSAGIAVIDGQRQSAHPPRHRAHQRPGRIPVARCAAARGPPGHGPHPLGHPWRAHRSQRPSPHRRHRPHRPGSQRHHRKLRRPQATPHRKRPHLFQPDRHRSPGDADRRHLRRDWRPRTTRKTACRACSVPCRRPCTRSKEPTASPSSPRTSRATLVVARKGSPLIIGVGADEYVVASDASAIVEHTTPGHLPQRQRNGGAPPRPLSKPRPSTIWKSARSSPNWKTSSKNTNWATTSITCSRKSSSSRRPSATACGGRVDAKEGRIVLGGLERLHARPGARPPLHPHRPGDRLARRPGRRLSDRRPGQGRHRMFLRLRIPLSQPHRRRGNGAGGHQPVRRNRRHAGRPARGQGKRGAGSGRRQRRRLAPSPAKPTRGIYLHAGPEIGVASTKAFTCQCVVLAMLALFLGRRRFMGQSQCQEIDRRPWSPFPTRFSTSWTRASRSSKCAAELLRPGELALPGPRLPLSRGSGRGPQAQGNQLHPRRRACPPPK